VIVDVDPVADVHAVAVEGKLFVMKGGLDEGGDEFFRVLAWAVGVGGTGDDHLLVVALDGCRTEEVCSGLCGRVGRRGVERTGIEKAAGRLDRAMNFIGRTLQKRHGMGAADLQEMGHPGDIAVHEVVRVEQGTIDMGLCGKIEDPGDAMVVEEPGDELPIDDVAFREGKAWILIGTDEVAPISGIGQLVEDDEALEPVQLEKVAGERRANEASPASEQDGAELSHVEG
jgi:hypothetical protein